MRMYLKYVYSMAFLCIPCVGFPQTALFPLEIGNTWTYTITSANPVPDTITWTVVDSQRVDHLVLWEIQQSIGTSWRVGWDSAGTLWEVREASLLPWFDFTTAPDDTFQRWSADSSSFDYRTLSPWWSGFETPVQTFDSCRTVFIDDPGSVDEERSYIFAQHIGIVGIINIWTNQKLIGARIHGVPVALAEETSVFHPSRFLLQCYPNPTNQTVMIQFALPRISQVQVRVYDLQGRAVAILTNQRWKAGVHQLPWHAETAASGLYIVALVTPTARQTQRVLILK